ncbi:MAG: hypothetical protein DRP35_04690 [Candidatus Zixiibacteriota bacterium]|nr:MAG: hypothetical protein DRP35_04690 [candidate division Zixibacteria bacterium]
MIHAHSKEYLIFFNVLNVFMLRNRWLSSKANLFRALRGKALEMLDSQFKHFLNEELGEKR